MPEHNMQVRTDPDVGIPDLVRRLTEDSKRLVTDEIQLAKLEVRENIHTATRGSLRLAIAFGLGVVALVALTVCLAAGIGLLIGNMWAGALITGVLELAVAAFLIKRGLHDIASPSYTLPATRESLKDTAHWVAAPRAD